MENDDYILTALRAGVCIACRGSCFGIFLFDKILLLQVCAVQCTLHFIHMGHMKHQMWYEF